jgi:menaquinone-dependent protoporphyrinogen oxidase
MASVLVAHASKRGSTAEIAEAIAGCLREHGHEVDCLPVDDVPSLADYEAVVIGSAVYMKRWRGDARRFLRKHADELARMPLWVFSSGPVGDPAKDDPNWMESKGLARTADRLGARDRAVFGGRVPDDPKGPLERSMAEGIPPQFKDRRDFDAIRAWAAQIAQALNGGRPRPAD